MENESHHTTKTISVFDVWVTCDTTYRRPHYPSYRVRTWKAGSAFNLESAERIVREFIRQNDEEERTIRCLEHVHSIRVVEMPVGVYAPKWMSRSEYVYDTKGCLIDKRTIPYEGATFTGRSQDQVRFRKGELCEVLDGDRVYLGFVVEVPPSEEDAARVNTGPFHMDATDDSYIVLTDSRNVSHDHVNSLNIFRPMHKVSSRTRERLHRAYEKFIAFPALMESRDNAALTEMREAAGRLGWTLKIEAPRWEDDPFRLMVEGVDGFPDGLDLQIQQKKAWKHMDRILVTFSRLAGKPVEGTGYRLKKLIPPPPLFKGASEPDPGDRYYL